MTPDQAVLQLFNLTQNPFTGEFQNEFTTLAQVEKLVALVDGFVQVDTNVSNWDKPFAEEQSDKPVVILIHGPRGSGRSSAARYVAWKCATRLENWRKKHPNATDIPPRNLLQRYFVKYGVQDDHETNPAREIAKLYYERILDLDIDLAPKNNQDVRPAWDGIIKNKENEPAFVRTTFNQTQKFALASLPWPIFCFDNVRKIEQILRGVEVFPKNVVLIFTTSLKGVSEAYRPLLNDGDFYGLLVELNKLTTNDVHLLIANRWKDFGSGGNPPIPPEGIDKVFTEPFPLKAVVRMLAAMLSDHAADWIKNNNPDPPPPMSQDLMWRSALSAIEKLRNE